MQHFNLHFFKEKTRNIDKEEIINYLINEFSFTLDSNDELVKLEYNHPIFNYEASFYMTRKSVVPDIYKISPNYFDVNFHLSIPIISPNYFVSSLLEIVKRLSLRFDLFVYSELFDNVYQNSTERNMTAFKMVKNALNEKYPHRFNDLYIINENKLTNILKYLNEQKSLLEYYYELNTKVPGYLFIKDEENTPFLACNWNEGDLTVFPPSINYILFKRKDGLIKVISANEFFEVNDKFLNDVPGFLQGTKVIAKIGYKKLLRQTKKYKWQAISKTFSKYNLNQLIDL